MDRLDPSFPDVEKFLRGRQGLDISTRTAGEIIRMQTKNSMYSFELINADFGTAKVVSNGQVITHETRVSIQGAMLDGEKKLMIHLHIIEGLPLVAYALDAGECGMRTGPVLHCWIDGDQIFPVELGSSAKNQTRGR